MSRQRTRSIVILLALLLAVAPVAYAGHVPGTTSLLAQSDSTRVVVPAGEKIQLGMGTDLSNAIPEFGQDIANAGTLAVEDRNAAGGVLGFEVELRVEDDRCDPTDATTVANQFAADPQIVAIVGHICSGASIAASEIYVDARIPMVSPSATAVAFTESGYDVVNRVAFLDSNQGVVDARYLYSELGVRTLVGIHDNDAYGKGLAEAVRDEFARIGGDVYGFETIDPAEQDYRSVLTAFAADPPDAIFFGGYQGQAALLVNQMQEVGLEDVLFFSDDGIYGQEFIDNAGDAADGVYASFVVSAEHPDWDEAYEARFGIAPDDLGPFHFHAYDAANIIMDAIEAVGVVDDEGNLVIDREALILAVRNTADFEGLTGVLTCDEIGECGTGEIGVNVVEEGEFSSVDVPDELQSDQPFMEDMMDDMDDDMGDDDMGDDDMGDDDMGDDDMGDESDG